MTMRALLASLLLSLPTLAWAVPITFGWDLNPAHDAATFEVEVNGQVVQCPVVVTATDRRCTADLPQGQKAARVRAITPTESSAWSDTINFDLQLPGGFVTLSHFERAAPPTPPSSTSLKHLAHGVSTTGSASPAVTAKVGDVLLVTLAASVASGTPGTFAVSGAGVVWSQVNRTTYSFRRAIAAWRGVVSSAVNGSVSIQAAGTQEMLWSVEVAEGSSSAVPASVVGVAASGTTLTLNPGTVGAGELVFCAVAHEGSSFTLNGTPLGSATGSNVRSMRTSSHTAQCAASWSGSNGAGGVAFIVKR